MFDVLHFLVLLFGYSNIVEDTDLDPADGMHADAFLPSLPLTLINPSLTSSCPALFVPVYSENSTQSLICFLGYLYYFYFLK